MMKKLYIHFLLLCSFMISYAQVGINTETPDASAMLDIVSSSKGLSIPNINLKSLTDTTTIPSPKESLLVFNINPALNAGKGFYYWNGTKWIFLFSENNQSLIENLTKFYAKKDNIGYSFVYNPNIAADDFYGENTNSSALNTTINSEWTTINSLTTNIVINRSINNEMYTVSGMMQADNDTTTGYISTSIGVFVDDKLVSIKPIIMKFQRTCTYREFTVSFFSKNLTVGNHTVKFAIRNRGGDLGTDTLIGLTYGKKNPYSSCTNTLNDDETRMSSTIFINQPFDF